MDFCVGIITTAGRTFVERHDNITTNAALDVHNIFRRKQVFDPSICDWKVTPFSVIFLVPESEKPGNLHYPSESVFASH
jgi:hypothetical protein